MNDERSEKSPPFIKKIKKTGSEKDVLCGDRKVKSTFLFYIVFVFKNRILFLQKFRYDYTCRSTSGLFLPHFSKLVHHHQRTNNAPTTTRQQQQQQQKQETSFC